MAAPTMTVRCPRCAGVVGTPVPSTPWAVWVPCPHCRAPIPVVAPRDPPPLFSWEVYPNLYPPLPPPPTAPTLRAPVVVAALLSLTVLLLSTGAFLGVGGAASLGSHVYSIGGTVRSDNGSAMHGVNVTVSGENGFSVTVVTDPTAAFHVDRVPIGEVRVNVSAPNFAPYEVRFFLSPFYSATPFSGDPANLGITLTPGGSDQGTSRSFGLFPDLESFVATFWSGAILFGIAATFTGAVAWTLRTRERPALAVAAGATGVLAPGLFYILGIVSIYPDLLAVGTASAALGTLAATLEGIPMTLTAPSPDP